MLAAMSTDSEGVSEFLSSSNHSAILLFSSKPLPQIFGIRVWNFLKFLNTKIWTFKNGFWNFRNEFWNFSSTKFNGCSPTMELLNCNAALSCWNLLLPHCALYLFAHLVFHLYSWLALCLAALSLSFSRLLMSLFSFFLMCSYFSVTSLTEVPTLRSVAHLRVLLHQASFHILNSPLIYAPLLGFLIP